MTHYPLFFKVSSSAGPSTLGSWTSALYPSEREPVLSLVAIPPEFEGPGGAYSPEDFYCLALINCFVATFKVIAEKSKLNFKSLQCEGLLTVDLDEKGIPWMSAFRLKAILLGASDVDRAKQILKKTSQSCMILNSVKTEKTFEWIVESEL